MSRTTDQPDRSRRTTAAAQSPGRIAAVRRQLAEQSKQLTTAPGWRQWCRLASRLPTFSLDNTLLIAAVRPDATQLAGYEAWQSLGRQVRRGEKGLAVLTPGGAAAQRVTHLWDIAQTDAASAPGTGLGAASPAHTRVRQVSAEDVWDRLGRLAETEGLPLRRGLTPPGTVAGVDAATGALHVLPAVPTEAATVAAARVLLGSRGRSPNAAEAATTVWAVAHGLLPDSSIDTLTPLSSQTTDARAAAADVLNDVRWLLAATATPTAEDERHQLREVRARASVRLDLPPVSAATAAGTTPATEPSLTAEDPADVPGAALRAVCRDTLRFFRSHLPESWAETYLAERLPRIDADTIAAGRAPAEWTALTTHLRATGHTDDAIIAAGLASRARHGGLVDRFRDRLMLPIRDHDGTVVSFIGRARPGTEDDRNPKYLNGPTTRFYRKGEVVYGLTEAAQYLHRRPLLVPVEGPFDALAVTCGTGGRAVGLAALGTAWTRDQVAVINNAAPLLRHDVVVATDADAGGLKSARLLYDLLTAAGADPRHAALPAKVDPAELHATAGPAALLDALTNARPLSHTLIEHAIHEAAPHLDKGWVEQQVAATRAAAAVSAVLPPDLWDREIAHIATITGDRPELVRREIILAYAARPDSDSGITVVTEPTKPPRQAPARFTKPRQQEPPQPPLHHQPLAGSQRRR